MNVQNTFLGFRDIYFEYVERGELKFLKVFSRHSEENQIRMEKCLLAPLYCPFLSQLCLKNKLFPFFLW
jgi:hypothetical protein